VRAARSSLKKGQPASRPASSTAMAESAGKSTWATADPKLEYGQGAGACFWGLQRRSVYSG
jgi:hypothetical protein